ncbi:MAG: HAMP domain-containing protein, partial [Actinomycetota bacterium]
MTRRLIAGYLTLTLFVLLVLEIPLGVTFARREREELTFRLEHDAVILATFVEDTLLTGDPDPLTARIDQYAADTDARVVVTGTDGIAVIDTDAPSDVRRSFASRPEFVDALHGEVATGTRHSDTLGLDLLYVAVPVAAGGVVRGALRLTYPTSEVDARIRRNWFVLAGVAAISLLAAAGVGMAVAGSVTRPLRRVERAATALGKGNLATRAPGDAGPPEVRSLAAAFNDMADRLEELVVSQDAFVADASHQLRTPLTALRLRLENLEAGGADTEGALREVQR